ncbi:MAG TPA: hypothetical protein VIV61_02965, partial [Candidatus Ozemobacteraceae bacterium]
IFFSGVESYSQNRGFTEFSGSGVTDVFPLTRQSPSETVAGNRAIALRQRWEMKVGKHKPRDHKSPESSTKLSPLQSGIRPTRHHQREPNRRE